MHIKKWNLAFSREEDLQIVNLDLQIENKQLDNKKNKVQVK